MKYKKIIQVTQQHILVINLNHKTTIKTEREEWEDVKKDLASVRLCSPEEVGAWWSSLCRVNGSRSGPGQGV